jgi:SAM-dependent methyltransferase
MRPELRNKLRQAELEIVKGWFRPGMRILEVGGGNGLQASEISSWGCDVSSIDLSTRFRPPQVYFPVEDYDGVNIPFADESFDLVFSSNVLEHVQALPQLLAEIRRVLKPQGLVLHLLPTSAWRWWTSVSDYLHLMLRLAGRRRAEAAPEITAMTHFRQRGVGYTIKRVALGLPHGAYPNALSELYYFTKKRWLNVFAENGFAVQEVRRNQLFYTGHGLLSGISIETRRTMARFLGTACYVYVMTKR